MFAGKSVSSEEKGEGGEQFGTVGSLKKVPGDELPFFTAEVLEVERNIFSKVGAKAGVLFSFLVTRRTNERCKRI